MSTVTDPLTERLIAELHTIDGKAEIVDGKVVRISPSGCLPGSAAGAIVASLHEQVARDAGRAYTSTVAFLINLPNRKTISPDASFYIGPRAGMKFPQGSPVFAAEVRDEGERGLAIERQIAAKRSDYFAAGTKVIWDVDLDSEDVVRVYRADSPNLPTIYRRGELAEAEPAVPGWKMPVDELFE